MADTSSSTNQTEDLLDIFASTNNTTKSSDVTTTTALGTIDAQLAPVTATTTNVAVDDFDLLQILSQEPTETLQQRRSSILKLNEANFRRSSRRVSWAQTFQYKELLSDGTTVVTSQELNKYGPEPPKQQCKSNEFAQKVLQPSSVTVASSENVDPNTQVNIVQHQQIANEQPIFGGGGSDEQLDDIDIVKNKKRRLSNKDFTKILSRHYNKEELKDYETMIKTILNRHGIDPTHPDLNRLFADVPTTSIGVSSMANIDQTINNTQTLPLDPNLVSFVKNYLQVFKTNQVNNLTVVQPFEAMATTVVGGDQTSNLFNESVAMETTSTTGSIANVANAVNVNIINNVSMSDKENQMPVFNDDDNVSTLDISMYDNDSSSSEKEGTFNCSETFVATENINIQDIFNQCELKEAQPAKADQVDVSSTFSMNQTDFKLHDQISQTKDIALEDDRDDAKLRRHLNSTTVPDGVDAPSIISTSNEALTLSNITSSSLKSNNTICGEFDVSMGVNTQAIENEPHAPSSQPSLPKESSKVIASNNVNDNDNFSVFKDPTTMDLTIGDNNTQQQQLAISPVKNLQANISQKENFCPIVAVPKPVPPPLESDHTLANILDITKSHKFEPTKKDDDMMSIETGIKGNLYSSFDVHHSILDHSTILGPSDKTKSECQTSATNALLDILDPFAISDGDTFEQDEENNNSHRPSLANCSAVIFNPIGESVDAQVLLNEAEEERARLARGSIGSDIGGDSSMQFSDLKVEVYEITNQLLTKEHDEEGNTIDNGREKYAPTRPFLGKSASTILDEEMEITDSIQGSFVVDTAAANVEQASITNNHSSTMMMVTEPSISVHIDTKNQNESSLSKPKTVEEESVTQNHQQIASKEYEETKQMNCSMEMDISEKKAEETMVQEEVAKEAEEAKEVVTQEKTNQFTKPPPEEHCQPTVESIVNTTCKEQEIQHESSISFRQPTLPTSITRHKRPFNLLEPPASASSVSKYAKAGLSFGANYSLQFTTQTETAATPISMSVDKSSTTAIMGHHHHRIKSLPPITPTPRQSVGTSHVSAVLSATAQKKHFQQISSTTSTSSSTSIKTNSTFVAKNQVIELDFNQSNNANNNDKSIDRSNRSVNTSTNDDTMSGSFVRKSVRKSLGFDFKDLLLARVKELEQKEAEKKSTQLNEVVEEEEEEVVVVADDDDDNVQVDNHAMEEVVDDEVESAKDEVICQPEEQMKENDLELSNFSMPNISFSSDSNSSNISSIVDQAQKLSKVTALSSAAATTTTTYTGASASATTEVAVVEDNDDDDDDNNADYDQLLTVSPQLDKSILDETIQDVFMQSFSHTQCENDINTVGLLKAAYDKLMTKRIQAKNTIWSSLLEKFDCDVHRIRIQRLTQNEMDVRFLWGTFEFRFKLDDKSCSDGDGNGYVAAAVATTTTDRDDRRIQWNYCSLLESGKPFPFHVIRGYEQRAEYNGDPVHLLYHECHRELLLLAHDYFTNQLFEKERDLRRKYPYLSQIETLLTELSDIANAARGLCIELRTMYIMRQVQILSKQTDNVRFSMKAPGIGYKHYVELIFDFNPLTYPYQVIQPTINVPEKYIQFYRLELFKEALLMVKPGDDNYITRLLFGVKCFVKALEKVIGQEIKLKQQIKEFSNRSNSMI